MSEHIAAEIRIGGTVPGALVPELCQSITHEVVALDWGDGKFSPTSQEELLEVRTDHQGVLLLCLCDDQARWGEFQDLEHFLRKHRIAYDRLSEPKYEYGAELVMFRPGQDLIALSTDPQHRPIVLAEELEPLGKSLSRVIQQIEQGNVQKALRAARRAQRLLEKLLPPPVPPLEPFVIDLEG